jgi:hypothetical protein
MAGIIAACPNSSELIIVACVIPAPSPLQRRGAKGKEIREYALNFERMCKLRHYRGITNFAD